MDLLELDFNPKNRHPWELARVEILKKLIITYFKKNAFKALDIGSGDAFMAHSLSKKFQQSEFYCIDPNYNESIICNLKNKFKNNSLHLQNNIKTVDLNDKSIDVVTILDVLEHVPNESHLLNTIIASTKLKDDSLFIITVPAYQFLFSKHDVFLKHYRRYHLLKLKKELSNLGFTIIDSGYFFFSLLPLRALKVLLEKIKFIKSDGVPKHIGKWKGNKVATFLIKFILILDFRVAFLLKTVKINLPGLSCYAICRYHTPKK